MEGEAARTEERSLPIARASAIVSVGAPPNPDRNPPFVVPPGTTSSRFAPTEAIWAEIRWFAPSPIATMMMTAATPMIIPNIVRMERILFARSDRKAALAGEQGFLHRP